MVKLVIKMLIQLLFKLLMELLTVQQLVLLELLGILFLQLKLCFLAFLPLGPTPTGDSLLCGLYGTAQRNLARRRSPVMRDKEL